MKDHEDPSSWIPIYYGVLVCSREPPEPQEPCGSRGSALLVRDQTHRCRVLGLSPRT